MKKITDFFRSNLRQVGEIALLVSVAVLPFLINLKKIFAGYLQTNTLTPDNYIWYTAIQNGSWIASLIFFIALLLFLRKTNKDYVMNAVRVYHDYPYAWYVFCAKILGIKKCDLVLVPIHMQFKMAVNGTFEEYPLDSNDYTTVENEADCNIVRNNITAGINEVNFILEDTYAIEQQQIPVSKRELPTVKISRNAGKRNGRHYSSKFIEATVDAVREFNQNIVINVYATTNPMNTLHIARNAFASSDRGNIKHLFVYQQSNREPRNFLSFYKIY